MKVAAVVTEYRGRCHAQQLIDRLLWGYGWDGKHHKPAIEVVALYTDQVGEGDVSRGWVGIQALESLHQGQIWMETPHLDVRYEGPRESLFWRG